MRNQWMLSHRGMLSELLVASLINAYSESNGDRINFLLNEKSSFCSLAFANNVLRIECSPSLFPVVDPLGGSIKGILGNELYRLLGGSSLSFHRLFRKVWNTDFSEKCLSDPILQGLIRQFLAKSLLQERIIPFDRFNCVHIRRGDKLVSESELHSAQTYLSRFSDLTLPLLVITDDFSAFLEMKSVYPGDVFTTCASTRSGFDNRCFSESSLSARDDECRMIRSDIQLACASFEFVGAYSSNVARVVAILRNFNSCHTVDVAFSYVV